MAEDGWISRKRKRQAKVEIVAGSKCVLPAVGETASSFAPPQLLTTNDNDDTPPPSSSSTTAAAVVPASLMPHLGWTKMSACHVRKKRRRSNNWDRTEGVRAVAGRAVFFVHDPRPSGGTSERDESKIWFQGRFFPSAGGGGPARSRNSSPTSVSSERAVAALSSSGSATASSNSWGLLAVQNEIVDECLTCSEGGYRELDLTFIRQQRNTASRREKKVRWVAQDVIWTGGNMMALSTDPYHSPYSPLSRNEPGVKFEPHKLMEGDGAMKVAEKYFPSMAKRLRIHNVMNAEGVESDRANPEAMVLIGDMEVMAPLSFVKMRSMVASCVDDDSNDDGLWND